MISKHSYVHIQSIQNWNHLFTSSHTTHCKKNHTICYYNLALSGRSSEGSSSLSSQPKFSLDPINPNSFCRMIPIPVPSLNNGNYIVTANPNTTRFIYHFFFRDCSVLPLLCGNSRLLNNFETEKRYQLEMTDQRRLLRLISM